VTLVERRRLTLEEAIRVGESIPISVFLDPKTFKPVMSRSEWERLPRRRRWLDRLLGGVPPRSFE
jgi:hypothetical protein